MAVINITINESDEQLVSGIPRFVSIATDIVSSIFYTLDGSTPNYFSSIYTETIELPTTSLSLVLKIWATNGVDQSAVISKSYITSIINNTRLPHPSTTQPATSAQNSQFPFGTAPSQPEGTFLNPADAGYTIDNPALTEIPSGYDGYLNPNAFTNLPYNFQNYDIVYSTKDRLGQSGPDIGDIPGRVTVTTPPAPPEETKQFTKLFNPKAMVIFQDFTVPHPDEPACINRQTFSLQDFERTRSGAHYYVNAMDGPAPSGSLVNYFYNRREKTFTYYYYDSIANRWIISKTPDERGPDAFDGNLCNKMVFSRGKGVGLVFKWIPFARRYLY